MLGCATTPRTVGNEPIWRGRLSIQNPGPPPRSDVLGFELSGNPAVGRLILSTPLGQPVAEVSWQGSDVVLREGSSERHLNDLASWSQQRIGVALSPVRLFELMNNPTPYWPEWRIERSSPRLIRLTHLPSPTVHIRLVVDEYPDAP